MKCLVTGDAGSAGSYVAMALLGAAHDGTVLDHLITRQFRAISSGIGFLQINPLDQSDTVYAVSPASRDVARDLAELPFVGSFMRHLLPYLATDRMESINLIEPGLRHGVLRPVFSSAVAPVGGHDHLSPITDDAVSVPSPMRCALV